MDRDLAIGRHGRSPLWVVLATMFLSVLCGVVLMFNPVDPPEQALRASACGGMVTSGAPACPRRRAGEP